MNITSKTINEFLKIKRLLFFPDREQVGVATTGWTSCLHWSLDLTNNEMFKVYLETDKPMKPGKQFSVRLKFEYQLSRSLEGFYLSKYTDKQGNKKSVLSF